MRTTWNGSLTFGLVSIPVGLAPATKPAARQSDVSFRLLHKECLTPIKQKRWCPKHDRELAPDEIVKGWEAAKGQFVIVEEAELEALEAHDDSRSIEISQFVPVEDVDPIWRDRTYFLVPGTTAAQRRPYRLLLEAMRETGTGAIGRFVRSGRESLCLVRSRGESLVLETLYLNEDVYSDAEITEAVGHGRGEGARARARASDHRQPRAGPSSPRRLRAATGATSAPCSRPSWRASSFPSRKKPKRPRRRRSTCSRRSRRAWQRRRPAATSLPRRRRRSPPRKSRARASK